MSDETKPLPRRRVRVTVVASSLDYLPEAALRKARSAFKPEELGQLRTHRLDEVEAKAENLDGTVTLWEASFLVYAPREEAGR